MKHIYEQINDSYNENTEYGKIEENLNEDKEERNSFLDNQNEKEMEKLYKETLLKHPRKIIDGQITKYSFFSFSGFFCFNRRDYLNLGQAYITYFNTIKLLIIIFAIMTLIHLALIKYCYKFSSVYNFNDDSLLKTTLGNTIITYFNTTYFFFERNKEQEINIYELILSSNETISESFVSLSSDTIKKKYSEEEARKYISLCNEIKQNL